VGVTDPRSIQDYIDHGGYRGLAAALAMEPAAIVAAVTASGLRGRGGAVRNAAKLRSFSCGETAARKGHSREYT
jgi:NADH:ubiquinone oxidoreductase subunit F (NADH-binding)